jgi:hypothetical protein
VSILLGNGNGAFASAGEYGVQYSPVMVAVKDVNRDGVMDLATSISEHPVGLSYPRVSTEMNLIYLILFDMNSRIFGPYLAAMHKILIPSHGGLHRDRFAGRRTGWVDMWNENDVTLLASYLVVFLELHPGAPLPRATSRIPNAKEKTCKNPPHQKKVMILFLGFGT